MDVRMDGRTALVTGASRGMGLEIARSFAEAGATVVGVARSIPDELAEHAHGIAADLTDPTAPEAVVRQVVAEHGSLDVLVNSAGAFEARTEGFGEVSDEEWQRTFELNFFAPVRLLRAALPGLLERRGTVVNVSSITARAPMPPVVDYAAAKAALTNLGTSLAEELGPQGVQVVTVSPGPTLTPAWTAPDGFGAALARESGTDLETFLADFAEQSGISTGRMTDPREVATLVTLLASGALPNAHGVDLQLDGGQHKAA